MSARQAIIIGGGLGGIATALRLAHNGWHVSLFEKNDTLGGKMNRWRSGGFSFDTGPSLITMPWVFAELYEALGQKLEDHLLLSPVHPSASYVFDDGFRFQVSSSLPEWLSTLETIEPGSTAGFFSFMRLGSRIFELSRHTFLSRAPSERPDLAALMAMRHFPLRHAWGAYHRAIAHFFKSPYLRQLYNRFPTYVGSSPYRIPATLLLIPYIEHAFGGWYVSGGLYRIIEPLHALANSLSVEIHSNSRVSQILRDPLKRITGIALENGARYEADVVVMNGDASMARSLLGENEVPPMPPVDRSLSGFILLLGLRRRLPQQEHHTVYFSADYQREFCQLFDQRVFPDDPTVYVSMPSQMDRSICTTDGETLFIMANAPANDGEMWDEAFTLQVRKRVLARLHKGGLALNDEDVAASAIWTPQRLAQAYDMPGGVIYGTNSHGWKNAFQRPPNRDRRYRGLYYVGGSTHPGGGTPTVLMSAKITARLIDKYESSQ